MELSILLLVATFFVALLSSILSGIAGGGGGFIMAPWQLLIGFSPVQMVATGSIGGSSMAVGSLLAMHHGGVKAKQKPVIVFSLIAVIASIFASVLLPRIDPEHFKTAIAILTLLSLPLFFSRHHRFRAGHRSKATRLVGYVVMSLLIVVGSILFTSTFALLMTLALPFFFGMSILESIALRRIIGLVQMIVLAVILHEYIVWIYTLTTISAGLLGSYIGARIAVRKGEDFARTAIAVMAVASAIALLF